MGQIKRSQIATYLNTGTIAIPVWALLGLGITAASIQYNPKVSEEAYIHEDSMNSFVESYAPKMPIQATAFLGDPVFTYIEALRRARKVGVDAETEICNVLLYETPAGDSYPAEKQAVTIAIDEFGGAGGETVKVPFVISFIGDLVDGDYDVVLDVFTPTP